ncbi:hypothetical protein [Streptomyces sp. NPDC048611]|uniref:hypothetical protein n=1 Tax=Streptomyces sp. NPDC048611 TaxID=3155635 RepID=UPI003412329F
MPAVFAVLEVFAGSAVCGVLAVCRVLVTGRRGTAVGAAAGTLERWTAAGPAAAARVADRCTVAGGAASACCPVGC